MATQTPNPRLKQALIDALAPKGRFAQSFAFELQAALPLLTPDAARESADDMLARRQASLRGEPLDAPLEKPKPGLAEGKIEELIESFAQPRKGSDMKSADALIHIYANIDAQRALHIALANYVYAPNGRLEKALADNIRQADPSLSDSETRQAAADYIGMRRARAHGVVEALRPGGTVERKAVALAEKLRREAEQPKAAMSFSPETAETPRQPEKPGHHDAFPYAAADRRNALTLAAFATAAVLGGLLALSAVPAGLTAAAWLGVTVAAGIGLIASATKKERRPVPAVARAAPPVLAKPDFPFRHVPSQEKTAGFDEPRHAWAQRAAARQPESLRR